MKPMRRLCLWILLGVLALFGLMRATPALAHERRMVGPYEFVVGFIVEPAFEGQKNGVDFRVQIPGPNEGDPPTPIEGVQDTLQVEVTHVPGGVSQVMGLRAIFGTPGRYTNDWIPTAPGPYRFRFFGAVEDLAIDEVFESSATTFGSVEPAQDLYFPGAPPQMREVEAAARGAQAAADEALVAARQAEESAGRLATLATAALVLGVAGTAAGLTAWFMARRK